MSKFKGFHAYKSYWEDHFIEKSKPWDEGKIVKLTISNNYAQKLKEIEFSNHSLTKENGKLTLRLKAPYHYHELDDFKLKTIELLGIELKWLTDFTVANSNCTYTSKQK